ncbi:MAG: helix-turn-helix domain-containing protein [Methanosarcinales archaeon]|nr:helix-turn-helix domain-containing protein [Methanosarcinales archaeon]
MKSPCEEVVWNVLPAIRAALAEELVKRDLSQREVSELLGITPPAVSQYVSKKRGYSIQFRQDVKEAIESLADDLKERRVDDLMERMCQICRSLREEDSSTGACDCRQP